MVFKRFFTPFVQRNILWIFSDGLYQITEDENESKGKFLEKGESRQVQRIEIERAQKGGGGSFPLLLRRKCITMILLFVSMLCFSPADLEVNDFRWPQVG